jgi:4a-hydroxytetrahydrobiopterin dehydratase
MGFLSQEKINEKLADLEGWRLTPEGLQKTFKLGSFMSAVNLVNRVADLAEQTHHHPEIHISNDKVTITFASQDASGVTENDLDLAARIEAVAP